MSIEHGESGRRSIQAETEVPGTPEDVWEAIATGPGIGSWFYPTELEERTGGILRYDTGAEMVHIPAQVAVWDPPRRFRHEGRDCGADGPPTATEWTIEPRSRDRCLVRVVHSLSARHGRMGQPTREIRGRLAPGARRSTALPHPFSQSAGHHRKGVRWPRRLSPRCLGGTAHRTRCRRARSWRSLGTSRRRGRGTARRPRRSGARRTPALHSVAARQAGAGHRSSLRLQDVGPSDRDAQPVPLRQRGRDCRQRRDGLAGVGQRALSVVVTESSEASPQTDDP